MASYKPRQGGTSSYITAVQAAVLLAGGGSREEGALQVEAQLVVAVKCIWLNLVFRFTLGFIQ